MQNLYKVDSKGKLRFWRIEVEGDKYRTVSGLIDGTPVESAWKVATPKNVGRSNETTGERQAVLEAESVYADKRVAGGYVDDISQTEAEGPFTPMLAEKFKDNRKIVEKAFRDGVKVFSQPKLDGFRNINSATSMTSRGQRPFLSSPHIQKSLESFFKLYPTFLLDGELYNHEFHANFNGLQSLINRQKSSPEDFVETEKYVQYHVYDVFYPDAPDLVFSERTKLLTRAREAGFLELPIVVVETTEVKSFEEIDEVYARYLADGYEGQILRIDGPYENKRTKKLIKRKEFYDEEYEIIEILEGKGNWAGKAKSVSFKVPESVDGMGDAGISGTAAEMMQLLIDRDKYVGGEVTVRFPNKTPDNKPRFGVAKAFYIGKRDT